MPSPPHGAPAAGAAGAGTAAYLAERLCAERGFAPGTVPEAAPLEAACHLAVTKADGLTFEVVGIVDRDADPSSRVALTRDAVVAVGQACARYAGKVNGVRMPVAIQLWEVGRGAGSAEDRGRLRGLARRWPGSAKVTVSTWAVDSATGRAWSSAPFGGRLAGRGWLEAALRGPRRTGLPEEAALPDGVGRPWLTFGILGVLAAVFAAELLFGVAPAPKLATPDVLTLVALGGLTRGLVAEGEWFRLLTAACLHADPIHLLFNGAALYLAGVALENLLGRAWMAALFVAGALGGAAASLALNPPQVVSVGASGAITCMLAAAFAASFRFPSGPARLAIQLPLLQVLVPALIPLATRTGGHIDYAAHLGGAAVGALLGVALLRTWGRAEPLPRFRRAAGAVALTGALAVAVGFAEVARAQGRWVAAAAERALSARLIPDGKLPATAEERLARAAELVAAWPRDPRARLFLAVRLARDGDPARAEEELRRGLGETEVLAAAFPDRRLETSMRALLAELLLAGGKRAEAEAAAAPACGAGPGGAVPEKLRALGVCR